MDVSGFIDALHSSGPAAECVHNSQLYAFLVGSWEMDVLIHRTDGLLTSGRGSIHAAWVLGGRAIQDVFQVPGLFHGTTLRFFDPHIDAWQIFWIDPMKQVFFHAIGRPYGRDIVSEGAETPELARAYGMPLGPTATIRWSFTEITPNSFHWLSERSLDGFRWQLQREYFVRRIASESGIRLPTAI